MCFRCAQPKETDFRLEFELPEAQSLVDWQSRGHGICQGTAEWPSGSKDYWGEGRQIELCLPHPRVHGLGVEQIFVEHLLCVDGGWKNSEAQTLPFRRFPGRQICRHVLEQ